jgi:type VI secretion system secreted protein VgrG
MNVSSAQADALGGCRECEPARTPAVAGAGAPPPSVLVVDPSKPDWVGIELASAAGTPAAGESFVLELADGTSVTGKLDNLGRCRVEGVPPGNCKVTFPARDAKEWKAR